MCLPPLSAPTGVKCCSQDPIFKKLAQTQSYISLRSKSVFPPHSSQLFSIVLLYGCTASRYQFAWLLFNYPEINRHLCKLGFEKKQNFSDNSFLVLTLLVGGIKTPGLQFLYVSWVEKIISINK